MKLLGLITASILFTACSTAQLYDVVAANTSPDCNKYSNADERNRCKKETDISYEQYERERKKAKGQ
jgi:hypothetical protein